MSEIQQKASNNNQMLALGIFAGTFLTLLERSGLMKPFETGVNEPRLVSERVIPAFEQQSRQDGEKEIGAEEWETAWH